jgi:hypothetical protein
VLSEERWKELEGEWVERVQAIDEERQRLTSSLQRSGADDAQAAFELLEEASGLYAEQSPKEQARALRILVSNCTLRGETLDPNYRKPFDLAAEGLRTGVLYA